MAQLAPPPDADVKLLEGLSDVTKITYRRALVEFQNWARRRRMQLEPPTDYDKHSGATATVLPKASTS